MGLQGIGIYWYWFGPANRDIINQHWFDPANSYGVPDKATTSLGSLPDGELGRKVSPGFKASCCGSVTIVDAGVKRLEAEHSEPLSPLLQIPFVLHHKKRIS